MRARTVPVRVSGGGYEVVVGRGVLPEVGRVLAGSRADGAAVITHPNLLRWHGGKVLEAVVRAGLTPIVLTVPPGERSKSFRSVARLLEALAEAGLGRGGVVMALGGGVIGDLAGFVAAVYHRGVRTIQVPTTVLAQVDAAVGGKVGVDLKAGKNLAGAFLQPLGVIADTETLVTLPLRHVRNGLAEALKYGFIFRPAFVENVLGLKRKLERRDPEAFAEVVAVCVEMKASVVEEDERDLTGSRARLNLGHTVGHAIETALGYRRLLHGEAISVGMVAEARLAARLGLCDAAVPGEYERALSAFSLPVSLPPGLDPQTLLPHMYRDKKALEGKLTMVLPRRMGHVELVTGLDPKDIVTVLKEMMGRA